MCFCESLALLCANSCPDPQWMTHRVDHILIEGDAIYLKAFDEQFIPDGTSRLTYLPYRVCI